MNLDDLPPPEVKWAGRFVRALTRGKWDEYVKLLKELEGLYPPETIAAQVYICPMHPKDRHLKPDEKCSVCDMALIRRLCDPVIVMAEGKTLTQGSFESVAADPRVQEAYLGRRH